MSDNLSSVEKLSIGRLVVPSLTVAAFAATIAGPIITLLAVDIARTFQVPTGVAAQLRTVDNAAAIVTALAMGFLAIRFRHKLLLLIGILFLSIFSIGGFFAPSLLYLQIFFAMEGIGSIIIGIMSVTIVGDYFPLRKKPKIISYTTAATTLANLVGTVAIGLIADIGGWRPVFLVYVLPISLVGLLMAFFSIPREQPRGQQLVGKSSYLANFRRVLSDRYAAAALVGVMLPSLITFVLFALSFYREQFSQSRNFTVVVFLAGQSLYILGTLLAGRLTNRFGTKPLILIGSLASSVLMVGFFLMADLWAALTLNMLHAFFSAIPYTAGRCLVLDLVPSSRSTMVSLAMVVRAIGTAVGTAVGGAFLILFSYQIMGVAYGVIGLCGAFIIQFLTRDPYKDISG